MKRHSIEMTHQPVHCSAGHEVRSYVGQTQHSLVSPVVTSRQPLQDLPELLPPSGLALLAGQHQVGVEVVGDEGGGQVPEIELQHRTHTVDIMHDRGVSG